MKAQPILGLIMASGILCLTGCGATQLEVGRNALGSGDYRDAIKSLEIAAKDHPEHPTLTKELASAYRSRAAKLLDRGTCVDAWGLIQQADEISDAMLIDHQQVYDCMVKVETDVQSKRRVLEHLMVLGDHRPELVHVLMNVLLDASEWKDAVRHGPTLERRYALKIEDRRRLGMAYFTLERLAEARHHLSLVVARNADDALSRLKLAEACEGLKLHEEARALYLRAAQDFRDNPVVFLRLAQFLSSHGDTEGAAEANRRANELRGIEAKPRNLRPLLRSRR